MTTRRARLALVALSLSLAAAAGACGGKSPGPGQLAPLPTTAPATGTLEELQNGDRACYVVIATDTGERQSLEGDFELCPGGGRDASSLIGQKVTWTTTRSNVTAAECEGNQDCGKSDEVELITDIKAAP
jgi:hypothetical protein